MLSSSPIFEKSSHDVQSKIKQTSKDSFSSLLR